MYQPEFEECWASGLVSQHDPISHIMEITLDKVNNANVTSGIGIQIVSDGDQNTKTSGNYLFINDA